MKVIIENKIPFINGVLEPVADVVYLAPEQITAEAVADADALFVRTRTRCDASLLAGSSVRWIGTATIGTDHIDSRWCESRGITTVNAPGCNAPAVAQYLFSALAALDIELTGKTLGVVGAGNVGGIVARWGESAGMKVLRCDPPRARREGDDMFTDLDTIAAEADIITFHVPMTMEGPDKTFHLANRLWMNKCLRRPLIVNAARGPVVNTADLVDALRSGLIGGAVIDCWEGEPDISLDLLNLALIATPHIAGYSLQGKQRATAMVVNAFARDMGIDPGSLGKLPFEMPAPAPPTLLRSTVDRYDIMADDRMLRTHPNRFEQLRNRYNYRSE